MTAHDREALEDEMTRYVLGELRSDEAEAFAARLEADPALAAEVGSLRRALDLMPYGAVVEPPEPLRARVLRAAGRRRTVARLPWSWGLAAAAALFAVVLGLDDYRLRRELELQRETAQVLLQPNVVLSFPVRGEGAATRAFGSVVLDLDAKKGAVVIHGLSTLPEDKVYRLWAAVGEKMVPCGEFKTDSQGAVVRQFPIPVNAYTAPIEKLILTLEPRSAPPAPIGPTVMISS